MRLPSRPRACLMASASGVPEPTLSCLSPLTCVYLIVIENVIGHRSRLCLGRTRFRRGEASICMCIYSNANEKVVVFTVTGHLTGYCLPVGGDSYTFVHVHFGNTYHSLRLGTSEGSASYRSEHCRQGGSLRTNGDGFALFQPSKVTPR